MKHGTIMLILFRNNLLQLSFIVVRGFLIHPLHAGRLSVIHTLSLSVLLNPPNPSHLPLTPSRGSLPPCYWTSMPNQSSNHSPSDLFPCYPLSQSLHQPSRPLLFCLSIVEETVAQTNRERRYPLVYHKTAEEEWQRDSRGEEDTYTDMRVKLITGDCQLEGKEIGLFASQRHPKNITSSHHVCPLQPQDHSSHQPSPETA